jgi:molecular chaperone GrpE
MTENIQWRELYDILSGQYQYLNTTLQECQRALSRSEDTTAQSIRSSMLKKLCEFGDDLFSLAENLERDGHSESVREGMRLIVRNYVGMLNNENVKIVDCARGAKFDPQVHEAVNALPDAEIAEGLIITELRKGYLYKDQLLRAARVTVSKGRLPD